MNQSDKSTFLLDWFCSDNFGIDGIEAITFYNKRYNVTNNCLPSASAINHSAHVYVLYNI